MCQLCSFPRGFQRDFEHFKSGPFASALGIRPRRFLFEIICTRSLPARTNNRSVILPCGRSARPITSKWCFCRDTTTCVRSRSARANQSSIRVLSAGQPHPRIGPLKAEHKKSVMHMTSVHRQRWVV